MDLPVERGVMAPIRERVGAVYDIGIPSIFMISLTLY